MSLIACLYWDRVPRFPTNPFTTWSERANARLSGWEVKHRLIYSTGGESVSTRPRWSRTRRRKRPKWRSGWRPSTAGASPEHRSESRSVISRDFCDSWWWVWAFFHRITWIGWAGVSPQAKHLFFKRAPAVLLLMEDPFEYPILSR